LANLQVRLPAVVIGGGLTGIDTATEVQTYYLVQIHKWGSVTVAYRRSLQESPAYNLFQYQPYENIDGKLEAISNIAHCKDKQFGPFTSQDRVTFIGDTHPR
jgi:NADPH-dependent glutamate synthase beta subunit-like oxidoreductase